MPQISFLISAALSLLVTLLIYLTINQLNEDYEKHDVFPHRQENIFKYSLLGESTMNADDKLDHQSFGPSVKNRELYWHILSNDYEFNNHHDENQPNLNGVSNNNKNDYHMFFQGLHRIPLLSSNVKSIEVWMQQAFNLKSFEYEITSKHQSSSSGITHVYLRQLSHGITIENAAMNLNFDQHGKLISVGSTFVLDPTCYSLRARYRKQMVCESKKKSLPSPVISLSDPRISISPIDALSSLMAYLQMDHSNLHQATLLNGHEYIFSFSIHDVYQAESPIQVKLVYLITENQNEIHLTWSIVLELQTDWYHAHISTHNGEVLSLVNWVSHFASYRVFPFGTNDPFDGNRSMVHENKGTFGSPYGWQGNRFNNYSYTRGNNVIAQDNIKRRDDWKHHHGPSSTKLAFDFPLDLTQSPRHYKDASVTNLFYWCNIAHDLFYVLGFDEKSGNFQDDNFDRGGKDGDAIIAFAQDGSSVNNGHFASPPDGNRGKLTMYIWDMVKPHRDGDLEADIIIHEYTHGVSSRLTGGAANSGCLGWDEAGGMSEGWGDFFATVIRVRSVKDIHEKAFEIAAYANGGRGIRNYPYSPQLEINPTTYGYLRKPEYRGVHARGEIWAQILLELFYAFAKIYGINNDWFNFSKINSSLHHPYLWKGNIMVSKIVVDGMKIQPCYPTFIQGRDAILLADKINYGGENKCILWKAFAKRGLGLHAREGGYQDFSIPSSCS